MKVSKKETCAKMHDIYWALFDENIVRLLLNAYPQYCGKSKKEFLEWEQLERFPYVRKKNRRVV